MNLMLQGLVVGVSAAAMAGPAFELDLGRAEMPPPVLERVRWIKTEKQSKPEVFARVEPYYEAVIRVQPNVKQDRYISLKDLTRDLLHPKYQGAVDAYPDVYAQTKAALERAKEREGKYAAGFGENWAEYQRELTRIFESPKSLDIETFHLIRGAIAPGLAEDLDPASLPAWEAGLLHPEVSLAVKGLLFDVVAGFEDPGSTPVLGWLGRDVLRRKQELCPDKDGMIQGKRYVPTPTRECKEAIDAYSHVARSLADRVRKDIALELAAMLRDAGTVEDSELWAASLSKRPEWVKLLEELREDSETRQAIEPLLVRDPASKPAQDD